MDEATQKSVKVENFADSRPDEFQTFPGGNVSTRNCNRGDFFMQLHVSCTGLNVSAHKARLLHLRGRRVWIWVISGENHFSDSTRMWGSLEEEELW